MVKRLVSIALAFLMTFGTVATALASTTIGTQTGTSYFEFRSDSGDWDDLKTPRHFDNSSGDVAYCLQHDKDSPSSSASYNEFNPSSLMSVSVQAGLKAILENGYPAKTGGFSNDEAQYATANAIRAYLREAAGLGYNFMLLSNNKVRPKSGNDGLYNWMLQLVQTGRTGGSTSGTASITATPAYQTWQTVGSQLTATVNVSLSNVSNYEMDSTPSGVSVTGYTGKNGDTLTITAPLSMAGTDVTLKFSGEGSAGSVTLYWYAPGSSQYQSVVVVDSAAFGGVVTAQAQIGGGSGTTPTPTPTVTPTPTPTPAPTVDVTVIKVDDDGNPLSGAQFQISGPSGSQSFTAGNNTVRGLLHGSYTLTEVQPPEGYIGAGSQTISVYGNQTVTVVNKITALEFIKTDAATGAVMGNVAFKIRGNSGYMKVSQVSAGIYRYSISGSETFHTDSSGKAVIRGLPLGSYTIEESVAPAGYALAASQGVTISTSNDRNNPAKASMKNDPLIFEFAKTDAHTGKALDGAEFKLVTSGGAALKLRQTAPGEYTPDTSGGEMFTTVNGKAIIRYIPKGTYRITEAITPTGYATAPDQTVSVGDTSIAGNPAKATMLDEPLTLEFSKTDSFASAPLDGATFKLLDSGGNAVRLRQTAPGEYSFDTAGGDTFTTASGKAVIRYLPKGAYRVEESAPPSGFMADTPKPVTIALNNGTSNPARTSMKDEPLTLEFAKTDALTGAALDGATFKLMRNGTAVRLLETASGEYRPDPQGGDTFTTSGGKAVIRYLPADSYKVEETAPPTGFMKDAPVDITITPQNGTSNPVKAAMKDAPLTLEFEKLDAFTQKPMDGAQFALLDASGKPVKLSLYQGKPGFYKADPNGSDTFTTKDGKATLYYLPEGKHIVREVKAAEGYASTPDKPVTILNTNSPANPAKQSMRDEPLALDIRKLDATDGLPIGGAVFSLLDEDGKTVKVSPISGKDGYYRPDDKGKDTFEVDATGMARVLYLPCAVYQVKEVQAPAGFAPTKEAATVTIRETNSVSSPTKLDVKNHPLMFELLKIDAITKEPLPGVSFTLLDKDGKTVPMLKHNDGTYRPSDKGNDSFTSGSDGYAYVKYLPVGKYTVRELAFEGYIIAAPMSIEVTEENTEVKPVKLTMENMPTKLVLAKLDDSNKQPLDGAVFRLLKDGKPLLLTKQKDGSYKVDAKGSETFTTAKGIAEITHIPVGKLTVEEVTPPTGYAAVKPLEIEITDKHGVPSPLKASIADKPYALSIHKVTKENKPLSGAGFSIKAKGALDKPLTFTRDDKGVYRYDPAGKLTTIMVDSKGEAVVLGLPLGEYQLEETVVPEGYFPAAPQKIIIKDENTTDKPIKTTVVNETFVKLGLNSDRWQLPLGITLAALALLGGAFFFFQTRRKRA